MSYHCSECSCPTGDKTADVKDSFYGELERLFDKFPKIPYENSVRSFSAKVGREDIFKLTIGNESLHEIIMIMELDY
jgi:hypothetical protein